MIRRILLSAVATFALVAVPAVAIAYDAPGYTTTVSDPTPAVGQPFTVTTTGAPAGSDLTLTVTSNPASISNDAIQIAGTKASTKAASAAGTASWSVTLSAAGTYTLAVTGPTGALVGDETVVVGAATTTSGVYSSELSSTGFDPVGLAAGALALITAGAVAIFLARRRQMAHTSD